MAGNNKYIIFVILFNNNLLMYSQNLITNGSFEDHNDCPRGPDDFKFCNDWYAIGSSDYFNSCADEYKKINLDNYYASTPNNVFGSQLPKDGNAYAGLFLMSFYKFNIDYFYHREYIQTKLIKQLEKGRFYKFEMYLSLGDSSTHFFNSIGILFSSNKVTPKDKMTYFISNKERIKLKISDSRDLVKWKRVTYFYKARGGEQYLTIGSFKEDFSMLRYTLVYIANKLPIKLNSDEQIVYYYIDGSTGFFVKTLSSHHERIGLQL